MAPSEGESRLEVVWPAQPAGCGAPHERQLENEALAAPPDGVSLGSDSGAGVAEAAPGSLLEASGGRGAEGERRLNCGNNIPRLSMAGCPRQSWQPAIALPNLRQRLHCAKRRCLGRLLRCTALLA